MGGIEERFLQHQVGVLEDVHLDGHRRNEQQAAHVAALAAEAP
jgi:hypothetical protein